MAELGPISQAILDYINERPGYIEIFRMINYVSKRTKESHSHKWYRTQLTGLALEGRIEGTVQRQSNGNDIAIRWRRIEREVSKSAVEDIEG